MAGAVIFFKRYWKEILVGGVILVMLSAMGIMSWQLKNRNKQIADLQSSLISLSTSLKAVKESQVSMENLMKSQAEILIAIQGKETQAEKIFTEKIINNSKVIEKWVEKPEDEALKAEYYKNRNESWGDMFAPWEEGVTE